MIRGHAGPSSGVHDWRQSIPDTGNGRVVRIAGKHSHTIIASGLTLPTSMTFGPDGNLYVCRLRPAAGWSRTDSQNHSAAVIESAVERMDA